MSQKKHKKRHSQSTMNAKRQAAETRLADEKARSRSRMDPTARNLLLGDLVFLAAVGFLEQKGMISDVLDVLSALVGVVLLLLALWFQFGRKKGGGSIGSGGNWPGLR